MYCRYCGSEIKENCRYCPKCGKEQDVSKIKKIEKKIKKEDREAGKQKVVKISLNKLIIIFLILLIGIFLIPKTIEYVSEKVYTSMQDNKIDDTAEKLAKIAVQDLKIKTENIKITKVLYLDESYELSNEILIYYSQKDKYDVETESVAQYNNGVFYTDIQYVDVSIDKYTQDKVKDYIYRARFLKENLENNDFSGYRNVKVKS